jgi:hypothetical protein
MSTFWTVITIATVVVILGMALWGLVFAPLWVPWRSGKS